MTHRAYAFLDIKAISDDGFVIEGIASTPTPDRVGDIVEPLGAKFALPMPLLWQHDSDQPIGHVEFAKPTQKGIPFRARLLDPATVQSAMLKERLQLALDSIRSKLVRAVSIGFRILEYATMESGGWRIMEWEWLELSAVTIPANAEATITNVKKFDTRAPAASGPVVHWSDKNPAASGTTDTQLSKGTPMKNIGAQIAALEEKRKEKAAALEAIQTKAGDEGRTKNAEERKQFDELKAELEVIVAEIKDLQAMETLIVAPTAKAIEPSPAPSTAAATVLPAQVKQKEEPGILFARRVKIKAISRLDVIPELQVAERMYGRDSRISAMIKAGEQVPGSTAAGNWGVDLVSSEGAIAADFAEYLRPATILGKFGQNGVPNLRRVPFRKPLVKQTGAATGYWVGEGKPKPVTQLDFDRSTLDPLKCATIVVLTEENIRDSSPSSDAIVRDDIRNALVELEDQAFADPTNAGSAGSKPAGILYGAAAIAATTFTDENDVILDVRSLWQKYIDANNPAGQAVMIMEEGVAMAAGLILNALGQRAFPGLTMKGGELLMVPVITSANLPSGYVEIVNASDVLLADDGEIAVDMSREASLEMKNQANITQDPTAGTGAALVSLWQNNLVGIRAEHTINWKPRRTVIGAYLTGVAWGGAVNVS